MPPIWVGFWPNNFLTRRAHFLANFPYTRVGLAEIGKKIVENRQFSIIDSHHHKVLEIFARWEVYILYTFSVNLAKIRLVGTLFSMASLSEQSLAQRNAQILVGRTEKRRVDFIETINNLQLPMFGGAFCYLST